MDEQIARFWRKVTKSRGGCWRWNRATNKAGYGIVKFGSFTLAHRVSWFLTTGRNPGDLFVLHKCDNPPCVRPSHLFLGTNLDNVRDREAKGRWGLPRSKKGVLNSAAKLDDDRVRTMRAMQARGVSYTNLSKEFGVTPMVAWRICQRRSWAHVA